MIETLGMEDANLRKQLKRAVKKLIVVWIRYGKNCESFFREQADSLYFDELSLIDQSMGAEANNASFSIVKMLERANTSTLNHSSVNLSMMLDANTGGAQGSHVPG